MGWLAMGMRRAYLRDRLFAQWDIVLTQLNALRNQQRVRFENYPANERTNERTSTVELARANVACLTRHHRFHRA